MQGIIEKKIDQGLELKHTNESDSLSMLQSALKCDINYGKRRGIDKFITTIEKRIYLKKVFDIKIANMASAQDSTWSNVDALTKQLVNENKKSNDIAIALKARIPQLENQLNLKEDNSQYVVPILKASLEPTFHFKVVGCR